MDQQSSLKLYPAIQPVEIETGAEVNVEVTLENSSDQDLKFDIEMGYVTDSGTYPVEYLLKHGVPGEYFAIDWLTGPYGAEVGAGRKSLIAFTINVPEDVQSGVYRPAIIFTPQQQQDGQVGISSELVATIEVTVTGFEDVIKELDITDFSAQEGSILNPSRSFNMGVENPSKYNVLPRGYVTVYSPSGIRIDTGIKFNDKFEAYQPGQGKVELREWEYQGGTTELGNYNAVFEVVDANTNEVMDMQTISFLVVPLPYLLAGIGILVAVVVLGIWRWRSRPRQTVEPDRAPSKRVVRSTHK